MRARCYEAGGAGGSEGGGGEGGTALGGALARLFLTSGLRCFLRVIYVFWAIFSSLPVCGRDELKILREQMKHYSVVLVPVAKIKTLKMTSINIHR